MSDYDLAHMSKVREHADAQIHELSMAQDKKILTFAGLFLGGISFFYASGHSLASL